MVRRAWKQTSLVLAMQSLASLSRSVAAGRAAFVSGFPSRRSTIPTNPTFRLFATTGKEDNWKVPAKIYIPEDALDISFVRSSGAGGQNVNKVNTQVQIRFDVMQAHWLPYEVRQRLKTQQKSRVNQLGILTLASQEHRTQTANRKAAMKRLHDLVLRAWERPKQRQMRKGISQKTKNQRKDFKRKRKQLKEGRRPVRLDD